MKRLMMAHILCAGLLMLSLESQGAGAGKKVAPKKKQEEKKKAAGAGAEVKRKSEAMTDLNNQLKQLMDNVRRDTPDDLYFYVNQNKETIKRLLEQGANPKLISENLIPYVTTMLIDARVKYDLLFKVSNDEKTFNQALYNIYLDWLEESPQVSSLDRLIAAYTKSGGTFKTILSGLYKTASTSATNRNLAKTLQIVKQIAERLVAEGASFQEPEMPESERNKAIIKIIKNVIEQRRKELQEATASTGLSTPIADIIAEYGGLKAPTEQPPAVGFEKEEVAPQLGSGMGLGGLEEDVAAGAGAGAPPAIPALTRWSIGDGRS